MKTNLQKYCPGPLPTTAEILYVSILQYVHRTK